MSEQPSRPEPAVPALRSADLVAIEPFLTGGIGLGPLDVLADIAYEWNLNNVRGQNEQELTANLAVAWPVSRWFTPLLELNYRVHAGLVWEFQAR